MLLQIGDVAKTTSSVNLIHKPNSINNLVSTPNVIDNKLSNPNSVNGSDVSNCSIKMDPQQKLLDLSLIANKTVNSTDEPDEETENFIFIPKHLKTSSNSSSVSSAEYLNIKNVDDIVDDVTKHQNTNSPSKNNIPQSNVLHISKNADNYDGIDELSSSPLKRSSPLLFRESPLKDFHELSPNVNHSFDVQGSPSKSSAESLSPKKSNEGSGSLDREWNIRYRQFLACMLSDPILVEYFEKPFDVPAAIKKYKQDGGFKITPFSP